MPMLIVIRCGSPPGRDTAPATDSRRRSAKDCAAAASQSGGSTANSSPPMRATTRRYQLATHDALTDLYNRRHFIETIEKEIARSLRHARQVPLRPRWRRR
jgi:GGDEF domain-containing protein